jgi:hypothetical protein
LAIDDDLGEPANPRGNDGHTESSCFRRDETETLDPRRRHEDDGCTGHCGKGMRMLQHAFELDAILNAE